MGIAALILGILAFFVNPCYICSILAIVLGIVSMRGPYRTLGTVGMILGIASMVLQFIVDLVLIPFTFGASFCL